MAAGTPYDVIVIGAGPGGYVAAIRAAQQGMKVACVEKAPKLGGTCLRIGCIPSKALLHASERYDSASHHFKDLGIEVTGLRLDLKGMMGHKDKVVTANTNGVEFLFKKNKIDWLKGEGKVLGAGKVSVGADTYDTKNIIIATGSDVVSLPGITIDEKTIVSSTGALSLEKVPETMIVIGGGVIGLELGSVWSRLGAKVTVIEYLDRILPGMDLETAREAQKILKKQGLEFKLGAKVTSAKPGVKGVDLTVEPATGGAAENLSADVVLVAVGRKPYTDGLGLKESGVELDERGRIKTDGHFKTTVAGIYAIGDVIIGPMLAHKAEDEGMAVVEMIAGQKPHIDYNLIPGVVYTHPEIATVGLSEEQLKTAGVQYKVGKFPFLANGRARAMNMTDGFVKILADAKTDKVLGCAIIGPEAGTLISEVVVAMEFGASAEDIARTCHAHPTLEEATKEAALAVAGRAVHI